MEQLARSLGFVVILMIVAVSVVIAEERDPLKPRVPPSAMSSAKALQNPIQPTPKNIAEGKALYEGKGTCLNCHGREGKGNGPGGMMLNPSPRNFTNCAFHKNRTDGELFWVIKNGSPGTGMVPQVPSTATEEEAWTIVNYVREFCKSTD
jgi:mono/diheme cytochrome c family protein